MRGTCTREAVIEVPAPPEYIVPHADHGDSECCGLIMPEVRGDEADLKCNECGTVLCIVAAVEAEQALAAMISGELTSAIRPECGGTNFFRVSPRYWRIRVGTAAGEW
jgi:hypothetical protein